MVRLRPSALARRTVASPAENVAKPPKRTNPRLFMICTTPPEPRILLQLDLYVSTLIEQTFSQFFFPAVQLPKFGQRGTSGDACSHWRYHVEMAG